MTTTPAPRPDETGDTAVLLVHGFGGDTATWDELAPVLERHHTTVERLLLTGHGREAEALRGVTADTWCADVRDALARLRGTHRRVVVVGHSLGAALAFLALAEHLVSAAVLVCPPDPATAGGFAQHLRERMEAGETHLDAIAVDEEPGEPLPLDALVEAMGLFERLDAVELRDPAPALLLAGGSDPVVGPHAAPAMVTRFPAGTRLVTYAGAGHDLADGPVADEVAADVLTFLRSV